MMSELGYCRHCSFPASDRRPPGSRPYTLLDYFPRDYLLLIDASHRTPPQIRGMYAGDRSRKEILVDYGFVFLPPWTTGR